MVMSFTEKEKKYLLIAKGNWTVASDCPDDLRGNLERKIDELTSGKIKKTRSTDA